MVVVRRQMQLAKRPNNLITARLIGSVSQWIKSISHRTTAISHSTFKKPALLWPALVTLGGHRDCNDLSVQTLSRAVTDDSIKCLLIGTAKSGADHIPRRWDQTEILAVGPDHLNA